MAGITQKVMSRSYHIGFIGLGQMGYPMASNLALKTKHSSFRIMDTKVDSADRLVKELGEKGIKVEKASSFQEFKTSDVIVTMLPASAHVKEVVKSLIPHLKKGCFLIDSSTIDPNSCKWIKENAENCTVIDAPVSGGTPGAVAGTLTVLFSFHIF